MEQCLVICLQRIDGLFRAEECTLCRSEVDTLESDLGAYMPNAFVPLAGVSTDGALLGIGQEDIQQLPASLSGLRSEALAGCTKLSQVLPCMPYVADVMSRLAFHAPIVAPHPSYTLTPLWIFVTLAAGAGCTRSSCCLVDACRLCIAASRFGAATAACVACACH